MRECGRHERGKVHPRRLDRRDQGGMEEPLCGTRSSGTEEFWNLAHLAFAEGRPRETFGGGAGSAFAPRKWNTTSDCGTVIQKTLFELESESSMPG